MLLSLLSPPSPESPLEVLSVLSLLSPEPELSSSEEEPELLPPELLSDAPELSSPESGVSSPLPLCELEVSSIVGSGTSTESELLDPDPDPEPDDPEFGTEDPDPPLADAIVIDQAKNPVANKNARKLRTDLLDCT